VPDPLLVTTISLALLSHTNVGKTTLARTLLRRDIGAVMDRAHVTEVAESHVLMRSAAGDDLVLWDTPGFGDSVRLQRRLAASGQPIGWFLSQVWDRLADRAFWCSQQALRAARESADVILYVVNASEDPAAGYVEPELQILDWLDKPALVLLNQIGTRTDAAQERSLIERWESALRQHDPRRLRRVLPFDAFARCWLHEHALLDAIADCVPDAARTAFDGIRVAWRERDLDTLGRSADVLADQLAAMARDEVHIPSASLKEKMGRVMQGGRTGALSDVEENARAAMLERLDSAVRESTAALVALHGLSGTASEEILRQVGAVFATNRAPDADKAGLWGGLVSGALGGLAADVAAGGLTFGAGALIGGIAGALGARKLTQRYNEERGQPGDSVRWSDDFLEARLAAAVLRYLAVAHFGRGRGEFQLSEPAPRWDAAVTAAMARSDRRELWAAVRTAGAADPALREEILDLLVATLRRLYPEPSAALLPASR
jgi:GTPase SAR1 family protein